MTTNNPTTYWAPSTALHKLASRHNNAPCILTDGPAEFNDVALIRLADYEALQAECEELGKELAETELRALKFIHQCNAHVELYQELRGERDHLQTECEKLRAAIRRLCNIYVVDDYYDGQLREERLEAAVNRAIDAVKETTK